MPLCRGLTDACGQVLWCAAAAPGQATQCRDEGLMEPATRTVRQGVWDGLSLPSEGGWGGGKGEWSVSKVATVHRATHDI